LVCRVSDRNWCVVCCLGPKLVCAVLCLGPKLVCGVPCLGPKVVCVVQCLGPKVVCGVPCLGPKVVCGVPCLGPKVVCGVLCRGPKLVCGVVSRRIFVCGVVCCVWDRNYCTLRPQPYSSQCINAVTRCCQHDVAGHNASLGIADNLANGYPSTVGSMAPVCIYTPASYTSPRNGSREVATLTVVPIFGINLDR
jgi:hypothetical protein